MMRADAIGGIGSRESYSFYDILIPPAEWDLRAGFSDISHFNRIFRSRFGDTPKGVRANHQTVCYAN
jgi:hypothetical protein